MRVLLIDDNPDDRVLVRRELERHFPHFDVEDIRAELDLRRALDAGPVDLVITDFELRWSNGIEVLERIKDRLPDCPVVMFTGTGTQEIAVAAMKAGLDDYVIKSPRHYGRLQAAIDGALRHATSRAWVSQRQRRFDEMLNAIGVGVFRATPEGTFRDANPVMMAWLGVSSLDELRAADHGGLLDGVRDTTQSHAVRLRGAGGEDVELLVSGGMVQDVDGRRVIEGVVLPVSPPSPRSPDRGSS